jgi:hypothetical protein
VESDEEQDEDVEVRETMHDVAGIIMLEHTWAAAVQPNSFCPSTRPAAAAAAAHAQTAAALRLLLFALLQYMLGFVDDPEKPTDLLRHRFPSKVGGVPVSSKPKLAAAASAFHNHASPDCIPNSNKLHHVQAHRRLVLHASVHQVLQRCSALRSAVRLAVTCCTLLLALLLSTYLMYPMPVLLCMLRVLCRRPGWTPSTCLQQSS